LAGGWCWFVPREKYRSLVADGWFVQREKYCWLVADKPCKRTWCYLRLDTTQETKEHFEKVGQLMLDFPRKNFVGPMPIGHQPLTTLQQVSLSQLVVGGEENYSVF
jgi:hypothetical protein